jgi:hypothetical protein
MLASLLVGLIGFGLAHTLAKTAGPLGLAAGVRWVLLHPWWPAWVRSGADCVFCWSFWMTLLATWLVATHGHWPPAGGPELLITWLAGFGLACFAFAYTGH